MLKRFKNLISGIETKAAPPVSSLSAPEDWLADIFAGRPAASGIIVTPRTAMTCAPVRCAVQAIAESVGQCQSAPKYCRPNNSVWADIPPRSNRSDRSASNLISIAPETGSSPILTMNDASMRVEALPRMAALLSRLALSPM